jgi:hypothetical protein
MTSNTTKLGLTTLSNVIGSILTYGGLTGDSKILVDLGTKFPDNLRNSKLISTAIEKLVHFKWSFEAAEGTISDLSITPG